MSCTRQTVETDGSCWYVSEGWLVVTLAKREQRYWPHVCEGDPGVDTTDCELSETTLADVRDDTRAALRAVSEGRRA